MRSSSQVLKRRKRRNTTNSQYQRPSELPTPRKKESHSRADLHPHILNSQDITSHGPSTVLTYLSPAKRLSSVHVSLAAGCGDLIIPWRKHARTHARLIRLNEQDVLLSLSSWHPCCFRQLGWPRQLYRCGPAASSKVPGDQLSAGPSSMGTCRYARDAVPSESPVCSSIDDIGDRGR